MLSIRRLVQGKEETLEAQWAKVLTGLLREVDPNLPETHTAYLPGLEEPLETGENEID
jgi:hypothetical protein